MTTEEQIDFMIEHLEKETEAEARQAQFDSITPNPNDGLPPAAMVPNIENNVIESKVSEIAKDWDIVTED